MLNNFVFKVICNFIRFFIRIVNIGGWEELFSWDRQYKDGSVKPVFKVYQTRDGVFKRVKCCWWKAYPFYWSLDIIRAFYEVGIITNGEFKDVLKEDSDIQKIYDAAVQRIRERKEKKCQSISHVQ